MVNYNMTEIFTSNNIYEIYVGVNTLTGDFLSMFILLVIFLITYFNVNSTQFNRKLMTSFLVTTLVGALFFFGGLLSWYLASISPTLFLAVLVYDVFA